MRRCFDYLKEILSKSVINRGVRREFTQSKGVLFRANGIFIARYSAPRTLRKILTDLCG